jgi:multiple sugar transport system ATP-binding protein
VTHDQVEAMSLADRISVMNQGRIEQAATPVEIYRNPAARFVGSFIGNPPMNFIPAEKTGDGRWQVSGLTLQGPQAGRDKLEFAIRPEDVEVAPGGLKATARVVEPLGAHTLVTCDIDGAMFRAVLDSDIRVAPGDELSLVPKADRVRWFDPETAAAV